mmetsp:Transcript_3756/g.14411  ORF Transcript_3756/g.14411 Transcript_3756/m.14411 type:complete len:231 (+) Transcript_3756:1431-2123(+)
MTSLAARRRLRRRLRLLALVRFLLRLRRRVRSSDDLMGEVMVRVHARVRRDRHRLFRDIESLHPRDVHQRSRRRQGVRPSASDSNHPIVRFQHVSRTGDLKARFFVRHDHRRFEFSQKLIRAPLFRQLHARPRQLPRVLLELLFKSFKQRERVRGGAREPTDDARLDDSHFFHVWLHDFAPHGDLTVRHDHRLAILAHAQHRRGVRRRRRGGGKRRAIARGTKRGERCAS